MTDGVHLYAASLSGVADRGWATRLAPVVNRAIIGGIAIDADTRAAAAELRDRGRIEFLPADPIGWVVRMTRAPRAVPMGVNIRACDPGAVSAVGRAIDTPRVWIELNAHCRQPEICAAGAGEHLLHAPQELAALVRAGATTGATVGVKVRAEVDGVDLRDVARVVEAAGGAFIHIDTMDDPAAIRRVATATGLRVVANNGIRTAEDIAQAVAAGATAVSVGRPSTDTGAMRQIARATSTALPHP
jgi:TIM-barrel protein